MMLHTNATPECSKFRLNVPATSGCQGLHGPESIRNLIQNTH